MLLFILGAGGGFVSGTLKEPVYEASTTILISQAPGGLPDANSVLQGQRVSSTYAELLRQRPVLEAVISNLDIDVTSDDLDGMITATPIGDTNLLEVRVRYSDPQRTAAIANELVRVFIEQNVEFQASRYADTLESLKSELDRLQVNIGQTQAALESSVATIPDPSAKQLAEQLQLEERLAQYQNSYAILLDRYEGVRLIQAQSTDSIKVVETAFPGRNITLSSTRSAVLGAMAGIVIGGSLVLLIEYLNDTVNTEEEVAALIGIPTLAAIGDVPATKTGLLVTVTQPFSPFAEAYRVLRTNVQLASDGEPIHAILITSSNPAEGKTTTAANLAVTLAQAGMRTLLVDSDLRKPTLHELFQQENKRGITTILSRDNGYNLADHVFSTTVDNLYLMPSGPLPANPADVLQSRSMAQLVKELKNKFTVVIFDSPPVLAVADATLLARLCDVVLLVARVESTRMGALQKAKTQLDQTKIPMLAAVLNRVPASRDGYYYYHGYRSAGE